MNKFYIIVNVDPYRFLAQMKETDKEAHGTILLERQGVISLTTKLNKHELEAMSEVSSIDIA